MAALPAVLAELATATLGAPFPALAAVDDVAEVGRPDTRLASGMPSPGFAFVYCRTKQ